MRDNYLKFILALRPAHWSKNLIIFVPSVMAHNLAPLVQSFASLQIFLAMSFFASTGYLINDFFDKEDDSTNSYKKVRAYASGGLSKKQLFAFVFILLIIGLACASVFPSSIIMLLFFYLVVSVLYSIHFKKMLVVDILMIAFFFLFRLFIGHEVFGVAYSPWLLAFAFFFFFGLASIKRVSELQFLNGSEKNAAALRRAYTLVDLPLIMMFGIASGFISILILALYINSPYALKAYTHAEVLWLLCPLLLYWLYRLWILSYRGIIQNDPINFILSDLASYICVCLVSLILFCAI